MQNQAPSTQGQGQEQSLPPQLAPQVLYIQTAPSVFLVYGNYAAKTSLILGISRIIIGVLSIVFQIALIVLEATFAVSVVGAGIWCGVIFIIAGSFGVGAAATKTRRIIKTNMVIAIVSVCIFGTLYVAASTIGISIIIINKLPYLMLDLYILTLILALAQVVCDIWSAVICCKAVCCGRPAVNTSFHGHGQTYTLQQQQQQQQQQVDTIHQQQVSSVAYNPQSTYQYLDHVSNGNATPPPAYTQGVEKDQPQEFAA